MRYKIKIPGKVWLSLCDRVREQLQNEANGYFMESYAGWWGDEEPETPELRHVTLFVLA